MKIYLHITLDTVYTGGVTYLYLKTHEPHYAAFAIVAFLITINWMIRQAVQEITGYLK